MPALPWVRLDTDLPTNKKMLLLTSLPKGLEAAGVFAFALAWAGANSTDGYIPDSVLRVLHARRSHATALETAGLFERNGEGWHIVDQLGLYEINAGLDFLCQAIGAEVDWTGEGGGCSADEKPRLLSLEPFAALEDVFISHIRNQLDELY